MSKLTYISLFSSAGVGCYGFKMEKFNCVATNELLARRLEVQKANNKCKYESGYIQGDILLKETKQKILSQVELWKTKEKMEELTVLVATPPCQGMSVANHKKGDESKRNSLVVASLNLIKAYIIDATSVRFTIHSQPVIFDHKQPLLSGQTYATCY